MTEISGPHDLEKLLTANGLNISQWGLHSTKTVAELWQEMTEGETRLQAHPLQRIVEGVVIVVRHGDKVLIEQRQEFSNGHTRTRGLAPSEKMKSGESAIDAARRGLTEELGGLCGQIEIVKVWPEVRQVVRHSPSYPGLASCYLLHVVEARVQGLPAENFSTTERHQERGTTLMRHEWSWEVLTDPTALERRLFSDGT
jgi:hypothetical protein